MQPTCRELTRDAIHMAIAVIQKAIDAIQTAIDVIHADGDPDGNCCNPDGNLGAEETDVIHMAIYAKQKRLV